MKFLSILIILSLLSACAISKEFELTEKSEQLIGSYEYFATLDDQWKMIENSDSIPFQHYIFNSCDDLTMTNVSLTITRISKKKRKWLDKHDYSSGKKRTYDYIKMIVGCEGHHGQHYPMVSFSKGEMHIGGFREIGFRDENLGVDGHFIYFGFIINKKRYWFKFEKQ